MIYDCPFCGDIKFGIVYSYDEDMEIEMLLCGNEDCDFEMCIGERDVSHLMPRDEE